MAIFTWINNTAAQNLTCVYVFGVGYTIAGTVGPGDSLKVDVGDNGTAIGFEGFWNGYQLIDVSDPQNYKAIANDGALPVGQYFSASEE
jgi:hypothetical protein